MKSIITLKGRSNCGKSETLKNLCDEFKDLINKSESKFCLKEITSIEDLKITYGNNLGIGKKDYVKIYNVINSKDEKIKIGICTFGDIGEKLKEIIDIFVSRYCDLVIVATRTRGKTEDVVKSYGVNIIEYKKTISINNNDKDNNEMINKEDCKKIFNILENIIK